MDGLAIENHLDNYCRICHNKFQKKSNHQIYCCFDCSKIAEKINNRIYHKLHNKEINKRCREYNKIALQDVKDDIESLKKRVGLK